MLERHIHLVQTSSIGRLFDAVSSLLELVQIADFEGEAALALESKALDSTVADAYPFRLEQRSLLFILDWAPLITSTIDDVRAGKRVTAIAAKFHNTLVEMILAVVAQHGCDRVRLGPED